MEACVPRGAPLCVWLMLDNDRDLVRLGGAGQGFVDGAYPAPFCGLRRRLAHPASGRLAIAPLEGRTA